MTKMQPLHRRTTALYASKQFVMGRVQLTAFIAAAAMVFDTQPWPIAWFAALIGSLWAQTELNKGFARGTTQAPRTRIFIRTALSLFDTAMYSLAAAIISQDTSGLAKSFSLLIIMLTSMYALMYYYMQPRLLLLLCAPCIACLFYIGAIEATEQIHGRRTSAAVIAILAGISTVTFFVHARTQLSRARLKLVNTRTEAVERAKEAKAASEAKSEFLAAMSHEIRTPLNGVLGIAQVMGQNHLSTTQRDRLAIITDSGAALLQILNDILDISKIESGQLLLEETEFRLTDVVSGVHAAFRTSAEEKAIDVHVTCAPDVYGSYLGDPVRLRQILSNLVSNAIKFTEFGEVALDVTEAGEKVVIRVTDTGIGVDQDKLGSLFNKFVQGDSSTTRKYGGTGLGLSIVREIVIAMGGDISAESEQGRGSVFTVTLPLAKVASSRINEEPNAAFDETAEGPPATNLRVLAAEDHPTNQIVLKALLSQIGIDPFVVVDGQAAVEAWQAGEWDLILMDVQMPRMDGPSAVRVIRNREEEMGRSRTPILALTANAMDFQRVEYMASGMDGVIPKPIEAGVLFDEVQKALSQGCRASSMAPLKIAI